MKRRFAQLWMVLPVLLLVASGILAWQILQPDKKVESKAVAKICVDAQASDFTCWQQHYNSLVKEQSPKVAFVDFRKNYESNPYVKSNCHQIGHVIGRAAAEKYTTLAKAYAQGDNFCWSGYYHGAIETVAQQIGPEKIVGQINGVCADFAKIKRYSFDHYNCVHGMGHGLMEVKDDKMFEVLANCEKFDGVWQQQSCYSGVFMENVMNEVNPVKHSAYLKADDPLYPCPVVADQYKEQCYLMQTSHALIVEKYDYGKVFGLCAGLTAPFDATCYLSLGRDVSGQSSSQQERTIELCMLGTTAAARENCFTGAVKDFISYFHSDKQGLALCQAIPDSDLATSCTAQATEYYKSF